MDEGLETKPEASRISLAGYKHGIERAPQERLNAMILVGKIKDGEESVVSEKERQ